MNNRFIMKARYVLMPTYLSLAISLAQAAAVGRTELLLRESDVVFSNSDPLEVVVRLAEAPTIGARIDAAWIELTLTVSGDTEGFVPFIVAADAVLPTGAGGEYESAWPELAQEIVLRPAAGQQVRLDATRIMRHWRREGSELLLRVRVVDPVGPERPSESIQIFATGGVFGKVVLVTR